MTLFGRDFSVVYVWVCSALLVTILRFLSPADTGYDLGYQILAAQNLLSGHGLSVYLHAGSDLTDPPTLVTLTHFPSGYSLLAAALLFVGLDVGMVVRVLAAAASLVGWWGWARLAGSYFARGLDSGRVWRWAALVVAAATPLLFTPPWGGSTDVFLWAAVPWALEFVIRGSDEQARNASAFDCLAGAVCGLAFLIRYASLFLGVYAAVVILWQSGLRPSVLCRRWGAFALGFLPAFGFQAYVNYFLSERAAPGGLSFNTPLEVAGARLAEGIGLLHVANYIWAFWIPGKGLAILFPQVVSGVPWQWGVAVLGAAVLVLALVVYRKHTRLLSRDPRAVALGLFAVVPLTLLGSMAFGSYDYVLERRYYWPVVPLAVFVAYSLAVGDEPFPRRLHSLVRSGSRLYLAGYVATTLLYTIFMVTPTRIGTTQRGKLLGPSVQAWPSWSVAHELSPARRLAVRLMDAQRDAWLLTTQPESFFWDPRVNRSMVRGLFCDRPALQVTGPARIVIVTLDEGGTPDSLWTLSAWTPAGNSPARAHCFDRLPRRRLIQRFPDEGLKVLEAEVEAGEHIVLSP